MVIARTPMRISFLGGGTDYPDYYRRNGGMTLATSIDKYTFITVKHLPWYFDHKIKVHYSTLERCDDIDDLKHTSVRECLRYMDMTKEIEIHYAGDLPARTGMGSSSSFTVCLLHALHALKGKFVSNAELARLAVHLEQNVMRERVGSQDQYSAALGGLRLLKFNQDDTIEHHPIVMAPGRLDALQSRLMLFYTGLTRTAHEVLDEQMQKTKAGALDSDLRKLGELVPQAIDVLCSDASLDGFGELLHEGWVLKRGLSSQIANDQIGTWYETARQAGAVGGKLLGAGGGGCLLFYVAHEKQDAVRNALPDLCEIPFKFDQVGSTIVYADQN
ncbi:MAG: kinase [Armatimonadetes bacterium]|nr:kinase [Armatimonadota bacterium]MBS1702703.1 kinase [Armatimonadota bacterium]